MKVEISLLLFICNSGKIQSEITEARRVEVAKCFIFFLVFSCEFPWFSVDGRHYRVSSEAIPYWKVDSYCGSLGGASVASIFSESDYWTIKFYLGE